MKLNEVARRGPYALMRTASAAPCRSRHRYWIRMQGGQWYCAFDAACLLAKNSPRNLAALRDLLLVAIFDAG
jgi:hypothetical protein